MKQSSPLSKGSGKLGSVKYSVKKGAQIASEYQPKVSNPNTSDQQNTRSRFKLMSQLAAVLSDVIAIKPKGLQTARNLFQKINFDTVQYSNDTASIELSKVQLTQSNTPFVGFSFYKDGNLSITCELKSSIHEPYSRVVYVAYEKMSDGSLKFHDSYVSNDPMHDGSFVGGIEYTDNAIVLYAYAIRDTKSDITVKFGKLTAPSAESIAKLLVSSTKNMDAVKLTRTAGINVAAGAQSGQSD